MISLDKEDLDYISELLKTDSSIKAREIYLKLSFRNLKVKEYFLSQSNPELMLYPAQNYIQCNYKDGNGVYCIRPAMIDDKYGWCREHRNSGPLDWDQDFNS